MIRGARPLAFSLGLLVFDLANTGWAAPEKASPAAFAATRGAAAITTDAAIRTAVLEELQSDRHLVPKGIGVDVRAGIVELTGSLPLGYWRERAERVSRAVRDVRGVVNRVQVVGVRRPDREIAAEARRALRSSPALGAMPIAVTVRRGVVELDGYITSWDEQQLAERVACSVVGARYCQNRLSASGRIQRRGAVLSGDIRSRLDWDPLVEHDPIDVAVQGTAIRLSGRVGSTWEFRRASSLAWVTGVSAVDLSGLVVDTIKRPDANVRERRQTDDEILTAIHDLAAYWPDLTSSIPALSVIDGVAVLRGNVSTLRESRALEGMARSAVSVVRVQNDLRGPWWRPPTLSLPDATRPSVRRRRGR